MSASSVCQVELQTPTDVILFLGGPKGRQEPIFRMTAKTGERRQIKSGSLQRREFQQRLLVSR